MTRIFGRWLFQSTHPSGVRRAHGRPEPGRRCISIHAPQWGATPKKRYFYYMTEFQSTHPSGVRPVTVIDAMMDGLFQSTHPSGVRLFAFCHGPSLVSVFQSTHPSGVRRYDTELRPCPADFNPRTPVGCDFLLGVFIVADIVISIHAPQWGATSGEIWIGTYTVFQSTHPSGVRPCPLHTLPASANFNPRTPVGCDRAPYIRFLHLPISIHAPQWGATQYQRRIFRRLEISIHAPQWGATGPY